MLATIQGVLIEKKLYHSDKNNKDYHSFVISDGKGGQVEIKSQGEIKEDLYKPYICKADLIIGKFVSLNLISIQALKC